MGMTESTSPKSVKANKSPKMDVKDAETIKKDEAKYETTKAWKEQMNEQRKEMMRQRRDAKAKAKAKFSHDQWEHDQKQAEVRQKVDKVQGFGDAVAARIESEAMGQGIKKGAAGKYFKRLDTNRDGTLKRGGSEEVDRLLDEYAPDTNEITFEQYKRGVRKAIKRYKKENAMSARGNGADHLGR